MLMMVFLKYVKHCWITQLGEMCSASEMLGFLRYTCSLAFLLWDVHVLALPLDTLKALECTAL